MGDPGTCGTERRRRRGTCQCRLPLGHPPPHRCGDCDLEWSGTARSIAPARPDGGPGGPAPPGAAGPHD